MKYNSFIKEHKDITMSGTKRYENKSGEYYLQNLVKFQKNNLNQKSITTLNLKNNSDKKNNNSTNYKSNKNLIKIKKKKLNDELIPIPIVKQNNKLKNDYEKKNLNNAMDNAKYIRRYQYSNNIAQRQIQQYKETQKNEKIYLNKIKYIQIWWKTIYQIIKIQKYLRGYLYRIKLISLLDQREEYIDKVLFLIKIIKKIFLHKLYNKIYLYNTDNKKNCFFKWAEWNELINKKKIIKNLINNYSSQKIFNEFHNNYHILSSKTIDKNKEKRNDFKNEFYICKNKKNPTMRNRSFIALYNESCKDNKNRRKHNLSLSSLGIKLKIKYLHIGADIMSSQIIKRPKKSNIYNINQTNYKKKSRKTISNKKLNIFGFCKSDNKRNKTNNKKVKRIKIDKTDNTIKNLKEKYQKEKFFDEIKKTNDRYKENLAIFPNNKINRQDLTKPTNINENNKNRRLSATNQNNINKTKRNINNKKKINKNTSTNIINYSSNILNKKKKKKIKVYENKLKEYNMKLNLEKSEKELLSLNNNNKLKEEKLLPYAESIFDESQFSAILDSSTMNNNQPLLSYNNETDIFNSNKKMKSNSCTDVNSLLGQENIDINENKSTLKQYFFIWTKKTILWLFTRKKNITKKIFDGGNIITQLIFRKLYREFINKIKMYFNYLDLHKINEILNIWKTKMFLKEITKFAKKYILLIYFNYYKNIITKKIILQNIIIFLKNNIKKKSKQIKRRYRNQYLYSDFGVGGNNHFITDISINNYNNNFINNNISLNNNTNNCYIINN